jgi:hypothetical protein
MDFQKLNEMLSPYKIEIVCDNCQKSTERSVQHVSDFPEPPSRPEVLYTEKKQTPKGNKARGYSHSKSAKTRGETHPLIDSTQKSRRNDFPEQTGAFAVYNKNSVAHRKPIHGNAPMMQVNLRLGHPEPMPCLTIQEHLDRYGKTPRKIEDEDLERLCRSENRQGSMKLNPFSHHTAQPGSFCPEESPIPTYHKDPNGRPQTPSDNRALAFGPSRDASPFRPVDQRLCNTPSQSDKSPNKFIQFTPMPRHLEGAEDNMQENLDLLDGNFHRRL